MSLYIPNWKTDPAYNLTHGDQDRHEYYRDLWASVIHQAALDLDDKDPRNRHTAMDWFTSARYDGCSFLWVCDMLGLDPSLIRTRVLEDRPVRPDPYPRPEPATVFYAWRKDHGLTLEQVARTLHCSPVTVRNIERETVKCGQFLGRYLRLIDAQPLQT